MTDTERQLKLTTAFARKIIEQKERLGAPDAKTWREAFTKAQTRKKAQQ